jgi:hypothetical protein
MRMSKCDQSWSEGETIFVGKVIAIEKTKNMLPDTAHLLAGESFRGEAVAGTEIAIHTDGSNCNYPFVEGASYLVYATKNPQDGFLYTSRCTQTRPAVMNGGTLHELRAMPRDKLFGTIGILAGGGDLGAWIESQPLPGVQVRATDNKGQSFATQTDDRGAYAFASLPPGSYKIEPQLPKGFAQPLPLTAEVSAGGAWRVDHFAISDGRIEGTVVDLAGNPVAGFITIQPADPVEAFAARQRGGFPGYDAGPDGKFLLPNLPAGHYRLVFHPKTGAAPNFRVTFYWPSNPGDAIDLAFGQHLDGLLFKTPL